MLSSSEILQFLSDNKPYITEKFHCSEIGLFGSFARNEQTENSDIDIIIEFIDNTQNLFDVEHSLKAILKGNLEGKLTFAQKNGLNLFLNRWC